MAVQTPSYLADGGALKVQSSSKGRGKTRDNYDVTNAICGMVWYGMVWYVCMTQLPISRYIGKSTLARNGPFSQILSHINFVVQRGAAVLHYSTTL